MKSKFQLRLISVFLMVLMCVNVMQGTLITYAQNMDTAAVGGGGTDILSALTQEYGEQDGLAMYSSMLDMGIIDENGNKRTYSIVMDGKEYTIKEMEQYILSTKDVDMQKQVYVDNRPVTLETIVKIIETESYMKFVEDTFINNNVEMTPEHEASINSLENQITNKGIKIVPDAGKPLSKAIITTYVNYFDIREKIIQDVKNTKIAKISVGLDNFSGEDFEKCPEIKVKYKTLDGGLVAGLNYVAQEGEITFTKDSEGQFVEVPLLTETSEVRSEKMYGQSHFFLLLYDAEYASFKSKGTSTETKSNILQPIFVIADEKPPIDNVNLMDSIKVTQGEESVVIDNVAIDNGGVAEAVPVTGNSIKFSFEYGKRFQREMFESANINPRITVYTTGQLDIGKDETGVAKKLKVQVVTKDKKAVDAPIKAVSSEETGLTLEIDTENLYISNPEIREQLIDGTAKIQAEIIGMNNGGAVKINGVRLKLWNRRYATVKTIKTPDHTFRPGDDMPVTIERDGRDRYGYYSSLGTIVSNWDSKEIAAVDKDFYQYITAPYPAGDNYIRNTTYICKAPQPPTNIVVQKAAGMEFTDNVQFKETMQANIEYDEKLSLKSFKLSSGTKSGDVWVTYIVGSKMKIEIGLHESQTSLGKEQNKWLEDTYSNVDGDRYYVKRIYASYDNGKTKIPLSINDKMDTLVGEFIAPPVAENKANAIAFYVDRDASEKENFVPINDTGYHFSYTTEEPTMIVAEDLELNNPGYSSLPSGELGVLELGQSEEAKMEFRCNGRGTYQSPEYMKWSSNNENVALIDATTGKITPVGLGKVTFKLTATNGTTDVSKHVSVDSDEFTVVVGQRPAISTGTTIVQNGKDARVVWSSNIMYLATTGSTTFNISLYEGNHTNLTGKTPIWQISKYNTKIKNDTYVDIPKDKLTNVSGDGSPAYTVKIEAINPKNASLKVSALGYIVIKGLPATIKLERPNNYAILDSEQSYNIKWSSENIDTVNKADVEVKVVKNGEEVAINTDDATGTLSINLPKVEQLKDVYTITAKVKNVGGEAYSYDSYVLTVYNSKALKIWVADEQKDNIKLENESWVKEKSSAELVALARKIDLTTSVSINDSEYDYGTISDQIVWDSENSKIASLNYSRAGRTKNITDYDYNSYAPYTDFVLSGLNDGKTTINATHKITQIKAQLGVEVERLDNKLFLFQVMPKVKTEIKYTDGTGAESTVETDDNGAIAIYEKDGIKSDLTLKSTFNGDTYLGTIYNYNLVSGERDGALGELYPINNFVMKKAAKVEMNFLFPNRGPSGNSKPIYTPYVGKVTVRAGVYKNGKYCEGAEISDNAPFTQTETINPDKGLYTKQFDISRFWSAEGSESEGVLLSSKDIIQYVFELQFEDNKYKPQIIKVNGNISGNDIVKYGESLVKLEEAGTDELNKPFIGSQFMDRHKVSRRLDNIKEVKENIGISPQTPAFRMLTQTIWWGTDLSKTNGAMELYNENYVSLPDQSYKTFKYPFATMLVTEHQVDINNNNIWVKDAKQRGKITMQVMNDDKSLYCSTTAPYSIRNMMEIRNLSNDPEELKNIEKDLQDSIVAQSTVDQSDGFVQSALDFVGNIRFGNDNFSLTMAPTSDPTKFTGLINLNVGEDVMEGPGGDEGFSFMAADDDVENFGVAKAAINKGQDTAKDMVDTVADMLSDDDESDFSMKYQIGGYFTCSIEYDFDNEIWVVKPIGGGIRAGLAGGYSHTETQMVGPIPITFEVALGAAVRIEFDAHMLYDPVSVRYSDGIANATDIVRPGTGRPAGVYTSGGTVDYYWNKSDGTVTDYLTNLKLYAYIYAFGGLGFDASIIALKVGVFGQIELTADNKFLNRSYLDPKIADAVAPYNGKINQTEKSMNGTELGFDGQVGIKFVAKFLFVSFECTLASLRYSKEWQFRNMNKIDEYWQKTTGNMPTPATLSLATQKYAESIGMSLVPYTEEPKLEERSYLEDYKRIWNKKSLAPARGRIVDDVNKAPTALQSNAYPYADPIISDNGSMFVYLSDNGSNEVWDTTASYATGDGTVGYTDQGKIYSEAGFGDSQLSFQGSGNSGVAAWTRLTSKLDTLEGEELTASGQSIMMNSTDIYASIYKDNQWTTQRITENITPDLAPVVATNGNKAIVVWRSVYSANINSTLDFSGKDSIMYRMYDGSKWGEPVKLYNGASGAVLGLKVAMLEDATAAITYVIDSVEVTEEVIAKAKVVTPNTNNEIVYAVIDNAGDIVNNVRLTNDKESDQNPEITTVKFGDGDNKQERFLIGWYRTEQRYSKETESNTTVSDIRLSSIDEKGNVTEDIPSSLSAISSAQNIGANFKLVQMDNTKNILENLSILWVYKDEATSSDTLKGVKFIKEKDELYTSAVLDVAEMPVEKGEDSNVNLYTQIDKFDAYVSAENEVKAIILGSEYKQSETEFEKVKDSDGKFVQVPVVKSQTKMYTATETYGNKAKMLAGDINTEEIVSGFTLPIPFSVINQGKDKISNVDIIVNGAKTSIKTNIYPGTSQVINVNYDVPVKVVNVQYSGECTFANGDTVMLNDPTQTIVLDAPDVGIAGIDTISEQDGIRELAVGIYNLNSSKLKDSGRTVNVALYDSSSYNRIALVSNVVTISDNDDLDRIDRGAFTSNLHFDVKAYIAKKKDKNNVTLTEIPEKGIELFVKVWVEQSGTEVSEFVADNNVKNIICENLVKRNNGELVKVDIAQTQADGKTKAMLTLQNLSMQQSEKGNVVVNLLDSDKKIIETQYLSSDELILLGCEEIKMQEVVFDAVGPEVQAHFFNVSEDDMDNTLQNVSFTGVPITLSSEQFAYTATAENLETTNVTITSNNANATITLKKDEAILLSGTGVLAGTIPLASGVNNFTITVTPNGAGSSPQDYTIAVTNTRVANNVTTLDGLTITNGVLSPTFSSNQLEYTATVDKNRFTVTALPTDVNATVTGTGEHKLTFGENTIEVSVSAEDKQTTSKYTITVDCTAVPSVDATLASLSILGGTISPEFHPSTTSYTVNTTEEKITINALANDANAVVTGAGEVGINLGESSITVTVTAEDTKITKDYIFTVTRTAKPLPEATLSGLSISNGILSPTFDSNITSYTANTMLDSITVTATATDENAAVTVTGGDTLEEGANTITVLVTADGKADRTYTVIVTRTATPSTDATLSSLTISSGILSPTFDSNTTSYTATTTEEKITVTADKNDANAVVTGAGEQTLNVGENVITVIVTAQDNSTTKTYTVTVTRTAIDVPSSDATLASLSISSGILSPTFNSNTTSYTSTTTEEKIIVTADKNDVNAVVTGAGERKLIVGENVITVTVTAQDNITTKTYTVTVTRTSSGGGGGGGGFVPTPTPIAPILSSIGISQGTLTPIFNSKVQTYTATVENSVDRIDITATSIQTGTTISGTGSKILKVGLNTFVITATSVDGKTNRYTINVTRKDDARLSSIKLSSGTLSPSFKEGVTSYTATVPYDVDSVKISAVGKDKDTTVSGVGTKKLSVGDNSVTIKATSKAGKSNNYTIVITREEKETSGNDLDKTITITNKIKPSIDSKGNAKAVITKKFIEESINDAIDEFGDEIEVEDINIIADVSDIKVSGNFNIMLSKDVQDIVITQKVKSIAFKTQYTKVAFDLDTIKSIAKTAKSDVTISVKPVQYDKLSMKLKGVVSKRPIYDISVNYTKEVNGKKKSMTISKFSKGTVAISIPYVLHKIDDNGKLLSNGVKESAGNIYAVYVNDKGVVTYIDHSSYDENNKNVVFKTDHLSVYGLGYKVPDKKISDISKHVATSDIDFVVSRALMDLTTKTKFSPNSPMSRAMLAKTLAILSGDNMDGYKKSSFTDVKTGSAYMKYIEWAVDSDKGILKGTSSNKFSPNKAVTREELAVILQIFMDVQDKTLPITREIGVEFDDFDMISANSVDAVVAMQQMGIMVGKNGNKFDPDTAVTRVQVASIIRRYIELNIDTATTQGFDKNDSGKLMYYDNGELVRGKVTIDLITYTFGKDGVIAKTEVPYTIHTIKKGDGLWQIAKTYKVTLNDILEYNHITVDQKFALGDEIMIPKKK